MVSIGLVGPSWARALVYGVKSPVRDRDLWEISISNDHLKGTSTRLPIEHLLSVVVGKRSRCESVKSHVELTIVLIVQIKVDHTGCWIILPKNVNRLNFQFLGSESQFFLRPSSQRRMSLVTDVSGDHVSKNQKSIGGDFGTQHCYMLRLRRWYVTIPEGIAIKRLGGRTRTRCAMF